MNAKRGTNNSKIPLIRIRETKDKLVRAARKGIILFWKILKSDSAQRINVKRTTG